MAITYIVHYKDSEGYQGTTTVKSKAPMNQNELVSILEEQQRANNINAKIIFLDAKRIAGIAPPTSQE